MNPYMETVKFSQSISTSYRSSQQPTEEYEHICSLPQEKYNVIQQRFKSRLGQWLCGLIVITSIHPSTPNYFRSSNRIRNEVRQQVYSPYWFIIHPFSKLRLYFDIMMTPLALSAIFVTIFINVFYEELHGYFSKAEMAAILLVINVVGIVELCFNLFTGYCDGMEVVLNPISIANHCSKRYLIIDSVVLCAFIYLGITGKNATPFQAVIVNVVMLKVLTLPRCFKYMSNATEFFQVGDIKRRIIRLAVTTLFLTHFSACLYKKAYHVRFKIIRF